MAVHISTIYQSLGSPARGLKSANAGAAVFLGETPSRNGTVNVTNVTYSITKK